MINKTEDRLNKIQSVDIYNYIKKHEEYKLIIRKQNNDEILFNKRKDNHLITYIDFEMLEDVIKLNEFLKNSINRSLNDYIISIELLEKILIYINQRKKYIGLENVFYFVYKIFYEASINEDYKDMKKFVNI